MSRRTRHNRPRTEHPNIYAQYQELFKSQRLNGIPRCGAPRRIQTKEHTDDEAHTEGKHNGARRHERRKLDGIQGE
jgi:hypothetical protein